MTGWVLAGVASVAAAAWVAVQVIDRFVGWGRVWHERGSAIAWRIEPNSGWYRYLLTNVGVAWCAREVAITVVSTGEQIAAWDEIPIGTTVEFSCDQPIAVAVHWRTRWRWRRSARTFGPTVLPATAGYPAGHPLQRMPQLLHRTGIPSQPIPAGDRSRSAPTARAGG